MTQPQSQAHTPYTTSTVKPPPAEPNQPVPMIHANTQNSHTTLIVMSAYYGSQMLNSTMKGFDSLMEIYTTTGTITEGQLYTALWPETGVLNQAATIFGPEVISYVPARDTFIIRVGIRNQRFNTEQMQRITQALAVLDDTALARRVIYLACVINTTNKQSIIALHGNEGTDSNSENNELRLVTYARSLHRYIPDIDEQLAQIATAQHRPMRHGVSAPYHQTSTGVNHNTHAAVQPAYIGRDGGVCTSATTLHYGAVLQHNSAQHNSAQHNPAPDRVITLNPVVVHNISADGLRGTANSTATTANTVPNIVQTTAGTTVELRTVLSATQT